MVKPEIIAARLERLRTYLDFLETLPGCALEEFRGNAMLHGAVERYLHLSIECLIDIGNHLIVDQGLHKPESYAEVFEVLSQAGIIPQEMQAELDGMASFRNILVHDYLRLDLEKVYHLAIEKLPLFKRLAAIYSEFIEH